MMGRKKRVEIVYDLDNTSNRRLHDGSRSANSTPLSFYHTFPPKNDDKQKYAYLKETKKRVQVIEDYTPNTTPKGIAKREKEDSCHESNYLKLTEGLIKNGCLYEDPEFPANDTSIGKVPGLPKIEWRRPLEINPGAEFIIDTMNRFDIVQGMLGNCWALAVISSISSYKPLIEYVCPPNQPLQAKSYCGLFKFCFWHFGHWDEVIIDDRLPVKAGTNQLLFIKSVYQNEFWSALLEKAYAKFYGSYENLIGGMQSEAMEDFTGGLCETINIKATGHDLSAAMVKFEKECCLLGASFQSERQEQILPNGLVGGHAYNITKVAEVNFNNEPLILVRMRNPWGGKFEWRGPFSDHSLEWNKISEKDKLRLEYQDKDDGEFWMPIDEFQKYFDTLEVCHLGMQSLGQDDEINGKTRFEEKIFCGKWQPGMNAGGCGNYPDTFWTNPQYVIHLSDLDPTDSKDRCQLVIGLMQKDGRRLDRENETIGFVIYKVPSMQDKILDRNFFLKNRSINRSTFTNTREVFGRFSLPAGSYAIIPSTFEPNKEESFILRVFTQVSIKDDQLDDKNEFVGIPDPVLTKARKFLKDKNVKESYLSNFEKRLAKDSNIKASALQQVLNESSFKHVPGFKGFDKELCRSLIAATDYEQNGSLNRDELLKMMEDLEVWMYIFLELDKDQCGSFDIYEFREALKKAGYTVSNKVFSALISRYSLEEGGVAFHDFCLCLCRMKNSYENFKSQKTTQPNVKEFSAEDYMRLALYI